MVAHFHSFEPLQEEGAFSSDLDLPGFGHGIFEWVVYGPDEE